MAVHYAPRTKAIRVEPTRTLDWFAWPERAVLIVVGDHDLPEPPPSVRCYRLDTPEQAARDLYVVLHDCDAEGVDLIVVVPPPDRPEWHAILDRLRKATRPIE
jgi:L-threonylcarbamoyladenylate synthase